MKHLATLLLRAAFLACLLAAPAIVRAQETSAPDLQFGFAKSLYQEQDFYRAITEFKRFLFCFPLDTRAPVAHVRIADCYYEGERYEDASKSFLAVQEKYPNTQLFDLALFGEGLCYFQLRNYGEALVRFQRIKADRLREKARFMEAWCYLSNEDWPEALKGFETFTAEFPESPYRELAARIAGQVRNKRLPAKSPGLAAFLSLVCPGLGQWYAGRPRDALASFLTVGILAAVSVDAFQHDANTAGTLAGLGGLGFYAGNIYAGKAAAARFNQRETKKFLDGVQGIADEYVRGKNPAEADPRVNLDTEAIGETTVVR